MPHARPSDQEQEADAALPLVRELHPAPHVEQAFLHLASWPHCVFLDSARRDAQLGRYSYLSADPYDYLELPITAPDGLGVLAHHLHGGHAPRLADLPPFQGGAAGLFSYDLGRQLERLRAPRWDEFQLPALAFGIYDVVLAWDHVLNRAWLISQGLPETEPGRRRDRARSRLGAFLRKLSGPLSEAAPRRFQPGDDSLAIGDLAPSFSVPGPPGLLSSFTRSEYLHAVQRAIEYIAAGDVFQVNLSQRLIYPAHDDATSLYLRLRQRNPATFAGYFDLGGFQIASASPERFLRVVDGQVEARPIKGTRARTSLPEADLFAGDDLTASDKDRAENVMIVDLLRNDLSRACRADSIAVTQLCKLERYEYVQHLVSAIRGTLRDGVSALDLIRASFPGGSITGAPKVRAMQIIAELEPTARGAYCGGLGYLGFDGTLDTNILIRTVTTGRGWWQAPVGGGIVYQSVGAREYEETWHKAEGLLRSLR